MRAVVQRVAQASITVEDRSVAEIGRGLLVLVGVARADGPADVEWLADKIVGLRIFSDDQGLMNRSVADVGGALLVVSQFTLMGDARKGRRPSYSEAAAPAAARPLYEALLARLGVSGLVVQSGVFQADMKVALVNDGPVTVLLDSAKTF